MGPVRIRSFTLLCFFFIMLMPWVFFVTAHFIETKSLNIGQTPNEELHTVPIVSAFVGVLLAFLIVGAAMRRFLLKPLERMSLVSREVAAGDWEVELPMFRIAEIAEVRDGFEVMVKGLQSSYRKQAELEEERRFVIAAVAHDLRTPLFALRGYLDGLEQGIAQSPEKMAKYLAVCKEKSEQLDRLVEDLFTFTKMEYLETKLNEETIDFKMILQNAVDSLRPLAMQKHISISSRSADDCIVRGEAHLLERAMTNLLDNAVRHTPSDGEIVVQCYKDEHKVKFSIRDTGPGFSSEELERVFEPLYRGEASRNRSTGGSGLGLTISQRIVRRHGGGLAARNHSEGGALLTGWLPVTD
ncbi:sensor histidine kinase [Paenibacillus thailandensis]|uniref:histidine kinase n=1 Tax=Paenibacillus thailandensis TaxID=393250 RepID=A0ABW5QY46_9BACL